MFFQVSNDAEPVRLVVAAHVSQLVEGAVHHDPMLHEDLTKTHTTIFMTDGTSILVAHPLSHVVHTIKETLLNHQVQMTLNGMHAMASAGGPPAPPRSSIVMPGG